MRPVFLISIPAVQKVFNRITDASAQRLVDKVSARIPWVLWSPAAQPQGNGGESGLILCSGGSLVLILPVGGGA